VPEDLALGLESPDLGPPLALDLLEAAILECLLGLADRRLLVDDSCDKAVDVRL
jgi:hypothetical protein